MMIHRLIITSVISILLAVVSLAQVPRVFTGKLLTNNLVGTGQSSIQLSLPSGFTSNFTDADNDITGTVTCRTTSGTILSYPAWVSANPTTDRIVLNWITDTNTATRQELSYSVNVRKK